MPPLRGARHTYEAADYDELVDHPVELGAFWRGRFAAGGVPHEFVVAGAYPGFDGERLLADAQRICEAQIAFWHGRGRVRGRRLPTTRSCSIRSKTATAASSIAPAPRCWRRGAACRGPTWARRTTATSTCWG